MQTVYVFLAPGFEEIEAITPVDFLRRAGLQVVTVGVRGKMVTGGHGVPVQADIDGEGFVLPQNAAMVVLPGGGDGTRHLAQSELIKQVLHNAVQRNIWIGAICAAPTVLHQYDILKGKSTTAFPDVQSQLTGSRVTGAAVETDGKIITARSAGVALAFAHALASALLGGEKADEVLHNLYP